MNVKKLLAVGVIVLFLGMSVIPSTGNIVEDVTSCNNNSELVENSARLSSHKLNAYLIKTSYPNSSIFELEFSEVSNFTFLCNITGLTDPITRGTFSDNGIIIVFDTNLDLYAINLTTGVATYIGNAGIGELVDIAYDPFYQTIWGISTWNFYEINTTTGAATLIGPMGNPSLMMGLASDKNGDVYAIELDFAGGNLYEIDTSTGSATLVGSTGIDPPYEFDMLYDKDNDIMYYWGFDFDYSNFTSFVWLYGTPTTRLYYVGSNFTVLTIPFDWVNQPPEAPEINGPTRGKAGVKYNYTVTGNDPDGDDLYNYVIDWGDNNSSGTAGAVPSGTIELFNHTWSENGTYLVRARVVDIYGATSNWATLEVKMTTGITLYVGGSGPNNYTKIQDAINDSSDGDTIFVYNGTYYENIEVYNSIDLVGEDRDNTFIVAYKENKNTVRVFRNNTNISGFTIYNGNRTAIQIASYDYTNVYNYSIFDNNISFNRNGIITFNSYNIMIYDNIIENNTYCGISIKETYDVRISTNIVSNNDIGIRIYNWYNEAVTNCIIEDNVIKNNRGRGVLIDYCKGLLLVNNSISYNNREGVGIYSSNHATISNNSINNNQHRGISIIDSSNLTISWNNISNNNWTGIWVGYGEYHSIMHNLIQYNEAGVYFAEQDNGNFNNNTIDICHKD